MEAVDECHSVDPAILILCVNYATDAQTTSFVRTAANCPHRPEHITVISNSPEEEVGSLGPLEALDGVRLLFPPTNLGYFGGAAFGLKDYLRTRPLPAWIIVSNADIVFHDQQFFEKLKRNYSISAAPDVVAPDVIADHIGHLSDSPKHQNPYMRSRPSAAKMRANYFISRHRVLYGCYELFTKLKNTAKNSIFARYTGDRGDQQSAQESIYAPFGAFIIFHRSYFDRGGSLDHGCFLYGEEIFVAETVRRKNMSMVYDRRLGVTHRHLAAASMFPSKSRSRYAKEAARYLVDAFFYEE